MGAKLSWDTQLARFKQKHADRYSYERAVYVNATTPIQVTCPSHGSFWVTPDAHGGSRPTGCKLCGTERTAAARTRTRRTFLDNLPSNLRLVTGTSFKDDDVVTVVCETHGSFDAKVSNLLSSATGCVSCGRAKSEQTRAPEYAAARSTALSRFIATCTEVHAGKYSYDLAVWSNWAEVEIVCPVHGPFWQRADVHQKGSGCKACSDVNNTLTSQEFVERATQVHEGRYTYDKAEYTSTLEPVRITCPLHGVFVQKPRDHLRGSGCTTCVCTTSGTETRLALLVSPPITGTRDIIAPFELDMYWPKSAIAVEVNGVRFHTELGRPQSYHLNKTLECKKKGIQLLHFWHDEVDGKRELVASMINQRIGRSTRIGARKLSVVDVSSKEAKAFLEEHHIQGPVNASVRLGLRSTQNGKLAMLMTFGRPRFDKGYEWELLRLASHKGLTVVGGASRLLAAFERRCNPKSLVSYANLRYSQGKVYKQLGFSFVSRSVPNFFWHNMKDNSRLSRYQTQRHLLPALLGPNFNPELSAVKNMHNADWYRVFDCGNLTYRKEYV